MPDRNALFTALGVELAPDLLEWALTDSSFPAEGEVLTNERLELLGDAVLGLVITDQLMLEHPLASQRELAKYRASVINMHTLAEVARSLSPGGLGAHLQFGSDEHRDRALVLADTLEAVFGAIYLQHGISIATEVVRRLFEPLIKRTVGSAHDDLARKPPWPAANTEVTIYSSSDSGEDLRDAVLDLLDTCGFDFVSATYPVVGSWFQRLFVRERDSAAGKKLEHLAGRLERAAELKYINTPRAETDEREANAIARLAEALAPMDEAIIRTSSVLFIKTGGRLLSWVLTEAEITVLNDNPQLMKTPLEILDALPRIKGVAPRVKEAPARGPNDPRPPELTVSERPRQPPPDLKERDLEPPRRYPTKPPEQKPTFETQTTRPFPSHDIDETPPSPSNPPSPGTGR